VSTGLNELFSLGKTKSELALAAQAAENNFVGMPCGIMDQAVSMMAQEHHALLLDCKTLETLQIPLDLEKAGLALLVTDTRAHHALTDGGYSSRRTSLENSSRILGIESMRHATLDMIEMHASELGSTNYKRSRHAVTEIARVHEAVEALRVSNFAKLGELLNASHNSLRDDYTVSCKELDIAVDTARALGALGSRMVGGGFGGSAIALVPVGMLSAIREGIRQAFSAAGVDEPQFFVAQPNAGATASRLG
jgi:galactokinase